MNDETSTTIERIYKIVDQLSAKHSELVWTGQTHVHLEREPLLQRLRDGMHGDLGKTATGRSAPMQERSVLDITAFTMYEDITGRIEAYYRALTQKPKRDLPEQTLRAWYIAFDNRYRSGKYTEQQMRRTLAQLTSFANRIKAHFDQGGVKEIEGECPMEQCGQSHYKDPKTGATKTALFAGYKQGIEPSLKCRACGAEWVGIRPLIEMGYYLKASVNEEALREMGIDVHRESA